MRSRGAVAAGVFAAVFAALTAAFWLRSSTDGHPDPAPEWARVAGEVGGIRVLPATVIVIAGWLALVGRWAAARFLLFAVVGAGLAMYVSRALLQAWGADEDGGRISDFPSGHAVATTAFVGALVVLAFTMTPRPLLRVGAFVFATLTVVVMSAGRVAAGAHTTLDVAGGIALGLAWLGVSVVIAPPDGSYFPRGRAALWLLVASCSAGFMFLAALHDQNPLSAFDAEVASRVAESMPTWLEAIARPFSWIGGWIGVTVLCVAVFVVLVRERAWLDSAFFAVVLAGSQLAVVVFKATFDRSRPHAGSAIPLPESAAFPSGHATTGVAVFGAAAVLLAERVASERARAWLWAVTVVLGIGIGLSRVVLNVHYVTDVLAGWCLGLAWLSACLLARDALRARSGER